MIEKILSMLNVPIAYAQVAQAGEVASQTQGQLTQLIAGVIERIPLWITAFIVIILTFIIARIVKSSVENRMATEGFEEEHKELSIVTARTANAAVLTIGITVGLKIAGIDLTTIIAAGAFGIGFALKDLIMNFIAGVMILTARHFSIGDIIKVKGVLGKIEEIQSRATVVKNFDGTKVVIPNAELFKNPVTSYTSNPFRRVAITVGVEYGSDLKKAMAACLNAAKTSANALVEPKPAVGISGFNASSIDLVVKVWVESRKGVIKTKTTLIQNIKKELDAVGINIPFPIRTIVFDEDAKREQSEQAAIQAASEEVAQEMALEDAAPQTEQPTVDPQPEIKAAPVIETPQAVPENSTAVVADPVTAEQPSQEQSQ